MGTNESKVAARQDSAVTSDVAAVVAELVSAVVVAGQDAASPPQSPAGRDSLLGPNFLDDALMAALHEPFDGSVFAVRGQDPVSPTTPDSLAVPSQHDAGQGPDTPLSRRRGRPLKRRQRLSSESSHVRKTAESGGRARLEALDEHRTKRSAHVSAQAVERVRKQRQKAKQAEFHSLQRAEEMTPPAHALLEHRLADDARRQLQARTGALRWTPEALEAAKKLRLGSRYKHGFQRRLDQLLAQIPSLQKRLKSVQLSIAKARQELGGSYLADSSLLSRLQHQEADLKRQLRHAQSRRKVASFRDWMKRWQERALHVGRNNVSRNSDRIRRLSVPSHKQLLLKLAGVQGRRQPGSREDRRVKEKSFRKALQRRLFDNSVRLRLSSVLSDPSVSVVERVQARVALRKECARAVDEAMHLKQNLLHTFKVHYNRLQSTVEDWKQKVEGTANSSHPVTWETLLRPPLDNGHVPAPMPAKWGPKLGEKLTSLPVYSANVIDCMEALTAMEKCPGCVPEEHWCALDMGGQEGCEDVIRMLRRGMDSSKYIKFILDRCLYDARARITDILCLDKALTDHTVDNLVDIVKHLNGKVSMGDEESDAAVIGERPNSSHLYFVDNFQKTREEFEKVQNDHPVEVCEWCYQLVHKSALTTEYSSVSGAAAASQQGFLTSLRRRFSQPTMTKEESAAYLPLQTCRKCWTDYVRKGVVGGGMEENGLSVDDVPPEIACLNQYERLLIARSKQFVSCVRLKTMSKKKLPNCLLLPATKGNAINLRITNKETLSMVASNAPLIQRPDHALRIYADVKTPAGKIWHNLVDVNKVLAALVWLKENNPFYADMVLDEAAVRRVDPSKFIRLVPQSTLADPNLEQEDEEVDEGAGNPLPPLSQPEPILTPKKQATPTPPSGQQEGGKERPTHEIEDAFTLAPIHDEQARPGEDIATFMQKERIKGDPLGHQTENLDAVTYPELFPSGRGCLGQKRPRYLAPHVYFGHRIRHSDPRWRRSFTWLQSAYFLKRDRAIGQGVYANTKTGSGILGLTVTEMLQKCHKKEEAVEKELCTMLQKIKGSKEYWSSQSSDLHAMDAEFGPATFFLTLSCAETKWPWLKDYLRALNRDFCDGKDDVAVSTLISKDRTAVSEFFWRRFKFMMEHIIAPGTKSGKPKEGVLGKVAHYYWRLEYQARGAPHIHMKLWIEGAPVLGAEGVTEDDVKKFIAKHVTCEIPSAEKNRELRQLVLDFQQHTNCTPSCYHFKKGTKGKGRVLCRYGFPRQAQSDYSFNSIEDVVKSKHRRGKKPKKLYQLPRTQAETRINDYNPIILLLWQANMDIQFVGEISRALNQYITGYITKGEKKETKDLFECIRRDKETSNVHSLLRTLAYQSTKDREVGLYEIIDDLLGHQLHGASTEVKWLGVGLPYNRKKKLLNRRQLEELAEQDPSSTRIVATNIIDDYYVQRHEDLESLSLHDIIRDYEWVARKPGDTETQRRADNNPQSYKLNLDEKGWFRKRTKPAVVKTPFMSCTKDRAEEMFYMLIQEFVPYRQESDLSAGKATYAEAFGHWVPSIPALSQAKAKKDVIDAAKEFHRKLVEEAEAEDELVSQPVFDADEAAEPVPICKAGFRSKSDYATASGLKARVDSLNAKQRQVWQEVMDLIRHQRRHASGECHCETPPAQVLKFISGGAGVGKSRLIETLTEAVEAEGEQVILAAPSGIAAHNIEGVTIHRAFRVTPQTSKGAWVCDKLSHQAAKALYHDIGKARLIIIDEVSMVSNKLLDFVHQRLASLHPSDKEPEPFGGMNVVVLGDLLQLPPVEEPHCFEPIDFQAHRKTHGCASLIPPLHLWTRFRYTELTENMRQKQDKDFADLLNRLRVGDSSSGMEMLQSRVVECGGAEPASVAALLKRLEEEGHRPVCLLPKCANVLHVNVAMVVAKGLRFFFSHATDQARNRKPTSTNAAPSCPAQCDGSDAQSKVDAIIGYVSSTTKQKARDAGGMPDVLVLAEGARVMLKHNIDVEKGLFNGSMGTLKKVVRSNKAPDGISHLIVDFDGIGEERIERRDSTYTSSRVSVRRSQLPLSLAFAITIHSSQGLSLDCVVTDLGPDIFAAGQAYVALSRARSLSGLHLLQLAPAQIWCDLKAISEYNRLRALYTDLGPMVAAPRSTLPADLRRSTMAKKGVSRPLAQAGIDILCSPPPAKKARVQAPKRPAKGPLHKSPPKVARSGNAGSGVVGFVPLLNPRNQCFANAATQALLCLPEVQTWASLGDRAPADSIQHRLSELDEAQAAGVVDPENIRDGIMAKISAKVPVDYLNGEQWDSLEFLAYIVEKEKALKPLFRFTSSYVFHCQNCGDQYEQDRGEESWVLRLRRPVGLLRTVAWDDLLKESLRSEQDKQCDVCNDRRADLAGAQPNSPFVVHQRLSFGQHQRYLIVQLTRFGQEYAGAPFRLSTTKISGFSAASMKIGGVNWRTMAAVLHAGETAKAGHYWAVTRHGSAWLHKNDSTSRPMSKFLCQLAEGKNSAAYVIMERS